MVSLKQLRHLTAIAEQGNMHRAAEALHITQPALTRSLNTLEGLLNVRLFDRHSGGMQATPFCLEIIEKCQQVLFDVEDIQRAAGLYQNIAVGELNIGVGRGLRELALRTSIPEFVTQHPDIRINVNEGTHEELLQGLKKRNIDLLVIGLGSFEDSSEFRKELITNLPLSVMARKDHPLQPEKNVSFSQISEYPLIAPTLVGSAHPVLISVTDVVPEIVTPHITCSDYPTLKGVLMCSDCLLISAPFNCEEELQQGSLVELDVTHPALNTELGIIEVDKRSRSPAAQEFINILDRVLTR